MSNYDFQVTLHRSSGLAKDDTVNVLHFDINLPDTPAGIASQIAQLYVDNDILFSASVSGVQVKAYEPGIGGPIAVQTGNVQGGTGSAAAELACCLSYYADDQPNNNKRRRGRIYFGPLSQTYGEGERPSTTLRTAVLQFGQDLASIGLAGNTTWKMYSAADDEYHKIERIAVDDAWDVQRRRGLDPTVRVMQDVQ